MLKLITLSFVSLSFFASFASASQASVDNQREIVVSTCVEPIAVPNPENFGIIHHTDSEGSSSIASYSLHYRQLVRKIIIVSGVTGQVTQIPVTEEQNLSRDYERRASAYNTWKSQDQAASDWITEDIRNFIAEQAPLLCK
jgi:hypothetical protein